MRRTLLLFASACLVATHVHAAKWQVNRVNHMVLTPPGGVTVAEMSGVTYAGNAGGVHHFYAAEETKGELLHFDLAIDATGSITAISNIFAVPMSPLEDLEDYEGIAYTNVDRNSVFLSDEDTVGAGDRVGVREVSLATGAELQAVTIPAVFANIVANRGFESLARSPDGAVMWTANEQALTVDGPISTPSAGSDVRLLKLNVAGNAVAAGSQYVYHVEPIHGSAITGTTSGLSDLTVLPDGTVLALERSLAFATPFYLNRIYEIGFAGATDVSVGPAAAGLIGQTFTPVAKQLLWSGAADGGSGQNLEGLVLGPRLANGSWVLVGVVDNGDPLSSNTIVAFTATAIPSADFDDDGDVDGGDFLSWQRGLGKSIGATHGEGDADRDGDVDAADLTLWKTAFGAPAIGAAATVPEPATAAMTLCGAAAAAVRPRRQTRAGEGNRTLA